MNFFATFGQYCCGLVLVLLALGCELCGQTMYRIGTVFILAGRYSMMLTEGLIEAALQIEKL